MEDIRERDGSSGNFFTKDRGPVVGIALAVLVVGIVVGVLIALVGVGERTLFPGAGMGFLEQEPSACPEWRGPRPSDDWHQTACRESDGFGKVVGTDAGYVAISRDSIWTSSDGFDWSPVPETNLGQLSEAATTTPGVVVVGGGRRLSGLVAATPGVVVVGRQTAALGLGALVWFSPDGVTWSRVPHDDAVFGSAWMNDVTYTDGRYWAVGATREPRTPAVWSSNDGVTWTRVEAEGEGFAEADMYLVTEGGPGLVAVGQRRAPVADSDILVWTSSDGAHWEAAVEIFGQDRGELDPTAPFDGEPPGAIIALDHKLIAVGTLLSIGQYPGHPGQRPVLGAWLSLDDGQSWTKTSDEPSGNVVRVEGGVVATTPTGLLYSPDGQVWYPLVSFQGRSRSSWSHTEIVPHHVATRRDLLIVLGDNDAQLFSEVPLDHVVIVGPNPIPSRP